MRLPAHLAAMLVAAGPLATVPSPLPAQAVQAFRGLDNSREAIDTLARAATACLARLDEGVAIAQSRRAETEEPVATDAFDRARSLVREALDAREDPEAFVRRLAIADTYLRAIESGTAAIGSKELQASRRASADCGITLERAAAPAIFKIPEVSFVVGATYTFLDGVSVGSAEASTNLLGAAAGAAFEAIGSDALNGYFSNNITVGTAVPFNGPTRLTATLGLGLGQLSVKRVAIWPAINIEQSDSADERVPRSLVALRGTEKNWSSPLISLAVAAGGLKSMQDKLAAGKLAPVFTVGLRLPYYFPGDPFSALAALFSGERGDFEKAGKLRVEIGVYLPLTRLEKLEPLRQ